jgi:hypothetical protein
MRKVFQAKVALERDVGKRVQQLIAIRLSSCRATCERNEKLNVAREGVAVKVFELLACAGIDQGTLVRG